MKRRDSEQLSPTSWSLAGEHHSATFSIYLIGIPIALLYGLSSGGLSYVCLDFVGRHLSLSAGPRFWLATLAGLFTTLAVGFFYLRSHWRHLTDCLRWDRGGLAYQSSGGQGVLPWQSIEWIGADDGQDGHKIAIEGRDSQTSSMIWLRIGAAVKGQSRLWPTWSNTGEGLVAALEAARSAVLTSSFSAPFPAVPERRPLPVRVVAVWLLVQTTMLVLMFRYPTATFHILDNVPSCNACV